MNRAEYWIKYRQNLVDRYKQGLEGKNWSYNYIRCLNDHVYRAKMNLYERTTRAASRHNAKHMMKYLRHSLIDFKFHVEELFEEGMSWENYGYWGLQHIQPLENFDLNDENCFYSAYTYTNYKPVWKLKPENVQ